MRTFHIGGTAQVAEQSFFEATQRRHRPRSSAATVTAADGVLIVMSRNTAGHRPGRRQGPRGLQAALRRAPAHQGRRRGQARPADRRMGPLHHPDHHRSGRQGPLRGPGRRPVGARRGRRGHRHLQPRGHRLARQPARRATCVRRMAVLDADGGYKRLANGGEARYLLPVGAILSVGDGDEVKPGDVLARIPTRKRQDPRHHRRSAAGGRAVRGPPAQGLRGHRRDRRPRRIRPRLQEQAPHQDHPGRRRRGGRVPDPQGQAHRRPRRRHDPQGRVHHRRQPGSARHPADPWASRRWPTSWSTRSRKSTGCRACRSTTSTSRRSFARCCRRSRSSSPATPAC